MPKGVQVRVLFPVLMENNMFICDEINWKEVLRKACDANIVVFDDDAVAGNFTVRLIHLTSKIMRDIYGHEMTHVFVPLGVGMLQMYRTNGVSLIPFPEIAKYQTYGKYLCEDLQACRAGGDTEWAIACNHDMTCWLLMSY